MKTQHPDQITEKATEVTNSICDIFTFREIEVYDSEKKIIFSEVREALREVKEAINQIEV